MSAPMMAWCKSLRMAAKTGRKSKSSDAWHVPEFGYINDIEADLHDADTVYVTVNNHKRGDFPTLHRQVHRPW